MHDAVLRLARENAHPRDVRISFDEPTHQYTVDGRVVIGSVSSLWGSRFEAFDADGTARRCYPKWARIAREGDDAPDADVWTYVDRHVRLIERGDDAAARAAGVVGEVCATGRGYTRLLRHLWNKGWDEERCVRGVVALWSALGEAASARGTYVHLQCELDCNGEAFDRDAVEVQQYLRFREAHAHLAPFRTEWSVFARIGAYVVSGQVDAVYRDAAGAYHMVDYKCCAHALTPTNPFGKFGKPPFEAVPDTPWGHYACQQNIYRYVLERFYGVRLQTARLLRVHSTISAYELVDVPDLRANVARLFGELQRTTRVPNFRENIRQRFARKCHTLLIVLRLSFYASRAHNKKTRTRTMAHEAMKIKDAANKLKVHIKFADEKKRAESKGKGCVHHLRSVGVDGALDSIFLQLPRALTFGVRPNMSNNGPIPKYQLTLKYEHGQHAMIVDPLRAIHDRLKRAITETFHIVLPKTTRMMLTRINKKNKKVPLNLFELDWESDAMTAPRELFFEEAREKVDEICVFGGSEEDFEMHKGKAKLVSFAPAKSGKDGKHYEKSWMVNIACPIKMKRGGGVEFHAAEDGEIARPVFNFTACESPETDLQNSAEIPNEEILAKLAPVDGAPFSREGIAVVSLPYIHVRDDESSISVNLSLEHFHALARDQAVLGKRTFAVMQDDDTPQTAGDDAARDDADDDDAEPDEDDDEEEDDE